MTSATNIFAQQTILHRAGEELGSAGKSAVELIKDFDYSKLFMGSLFTIGTIVYADLAYAFFSVGGWYIIGGVLFGAVAVGFAAFTISVVFNGEGWMRHGRVLI